MVLFCEKTTHEISENYISAISGYASYLILTMFSIQSYAALTTQAPGSKHKLVDRFDFLMTRWYAICYLKTFDWGVWVHLMAYVDGVGGGRS